ncbi:putative GTP binding domain, P-loop containing nucleoside triphosphate hydrolase [Helianthus anomalus]
MNDLYQVPRGLLEQHMLLQTVQGTDETNEEESKLPLQLALVGRPNVGNSTLLNAILQEERVLVGPEASLTRDLVRVEFKFQGRTMHMSTFECVLHACVLVPEPQCRKGCRLENVRCCCI